MSFGLTSEEDLTLRPFHGEAMSFRDMREGKKDSILVVSPHPEDDILGAGGSMALSADQSRGVFPVYVTDGWGSLRKDLRIADGEMARGREKEALTSRSSSVRTWKGFKISIR